MFDDHGEDDEYIDLYPPFFSPSFERMNGGWVDWPSISLGKEIAF